MLTAKSTMKVCLALLLCITLLVPTTQAQTTTPTVDCAKLNNALRYLKVGNTMRESQQFELAEKYMNQALGMIRQTGDKYWEAAAYESLGHLYKTQERTADALRFYNQALVIYRDMKTTLSETALNQLVTGMGSKEETFAGIDIGAKGIKLSIVSLKLNSVTNDFEYVLLGDTSINCEPISLSDMSKKESAEAVKLLLSMAAERFQIPVARTFVVLSSGLRQELDKRSKTTDFITTVLPKDAYPNVKMQFVSPKEEGELSVLGIVPPKRRYTTGLVDVGSGNTKGGYFFDGSQTFEPFALPFGTKTMVNLVKSKNPRNLIDFYRIAQTLIKDSLGQLIRTELGRKVGMKNRNYCYLSGGIAWAIASYLYPEKINDNYMEITAYDVRRFKEMAMYNYEKLINPDMNKVNDFVVLDAARKNINRLQNTFDQESLIAGAVWMDAIISELNSSQPIKRFVFPKYSYVGWISGYVVREVNEEFNKKTDN
jgi:tetratricopeptide (TPR) repeat protein